MSEKEINKTLINGAPRLRLLAPYYFWFSLGFAVFNILIGFGLVNLKILYTLKLLGVVPLNIWGLVFLGIGSMMLFALFTNNSKIARGLNNTALVVKGAWWFELVAIVLLDHRSPFLLIVWSLVLFFQIVICILSTPRISRD